MWQLDIGTSCVRSGEVCAHLHILADFPVRADASPFDDACSTDDASAATVMPVPSHCCYSTVDVVLVLSLCSYSGASVVTVLLQWSQCNQCHQSALTVSLSLVEQPERSAQTLA